jgi:biopolymer transport protein ExbD
MSVAQAAAPPAPRRITVPWRADGSYDYTLLNTKMKEIKASFSEETKVIIAAEADTPYEVLVGTMDSTRETADRKLLFPDVTLASF